MKKIIQYIRDYWKEYYHLGFYLAVAGFLVICIFLNYYFDIDDNFN